MQFVARFVVSSCVEIYRQPDILVKCKSVKQGLNNGSFSRWLINEQGELQWRASLEISKDKVSKFWFHLTVPNDAITSANQFYGINSNVEKIYRSG
uniref:B1177_F3_131 n=1 Tax=Mycobacterium leprae TaxID=1769 RepID=Q49656_MYCLR|nr:B1177_F3_131 [Mycobacterium leprae]